MPKVTLQNTVRFSYVNVLKTRIDKTSGKASYSISILIPKLINGKPNSDIALLEQGIKDALIEKFKEVPKRYAVILKDGDIEKDDEVYEGHMYINAKSPETHQPSVIDAKGKNITSENDFYSGCFGRAVINLYGYDFEGKKGVAAGIRALMKTADGERFGSGTADAVTEFKDFIENDEDDLPY